MPHICLEIVKVCVYIYGVFRKALEGMDGESHAHNDTENKLKVINKELAEATGKSLGDNIISEAFSRIGVSTDLNRESVKGFAQISKQQGLISDLPDDGALFVSN